MNLEYEIIDNNNILKKVNESNNKYIIISNHYTALDHLILNYLFLGCYTISRSDLLSHGHFNSTFFIKMFYIINNYFFYIGKLIRYELSNPVSGSICINNILNKMKSNNIIVFPEGGSTYNGYPKDFKKGIFKLSKKKKIPLIICTLKYNKDIGVEIKRNIKFNLNIWKSIKVKIIIDKIIYPKYYNNSTEILNYSRNKIINNYNSIHF